MPGDDEYQIFVSHGTQDAWIARQIGLRIREDCYATTFLDVEDVAVVGVVGKRSSDGVTVLDPEAMADGAK